MSTNHRLIKAVRRGGLRLASSFFILLDVPKILNSITKGAGADDIGDGKISVPLIDSTVRIRTGEEGDKAT